MSDLYTGEKVPSPLARWITMNAEGGDLNKPFLVKSLARILKLKDDGHKKKRVNNVVASGIDVKHSPEQGKVRNPRKDRLT